MCSPSWTLLPPPSPYHPSGSSQCTSPKHPVSCIKPGLATHMITVENHLALHSRVVPIFSVSSVQLSCSVVSNSLQPHELQHARPPIHHYFLEFTQTHPSSQWCHPAISSSVVLLSCPQSLPASESFPMSQLFTWGGQSTGVSALASFIPKNIQDWSPFEWTGWISLQSKGLSRVFSNTIVQKHQFFGTQLSSQSNSHIHTWPQEKP